MRVSLRQTNLQICKMTKLTNKLVILNNFADFFELLFQVWGPDLFKLKRSLGLWSYNYMFIINTLLELGILMKFVFWKTWHLPL